MPDFAYTARDIRGERTTGTVSAASEREAISALSAQSLFPLEVTADQPVSGRRRRIRGQTMATLYAQLAGLLRSGVPLLRSLDVIARQTSNPALEEVLADVRKRVEEGGTMADAMARHPKAFSEMAVSMIRAGGEGGFLEDALDRVAEFTEQQEDLKSRTLGALAYPIFLAVVGTLVVAGLIVFFVPSFAEMFERLREQGELPLPTIWLLWTSDVIGRWGWLFLIAAVFAAVAIRQQLQTESGRRLRDTLKLIIPVAGGIFQSLAVARFCRVLGTLLTSGVPLLKALDISREATGNRLLSEAVERAAENVSSGQPLAEPLARSGRFPGDVIEMIAVAEESNTLDTVLVHAAEGLDRRTARRLDLMVRLLEPIMLLVLASVVLIIVIALLLPILKMSTTI